MTGARLPRPGGLQHSAVLRERVLHTLRIAPTAAGELRRRFGARIDDVLPELRADGLIVRDVAGDWWLTPAGRTAARGPASTTTTTTTEATT